MTVHANLCDGRLARCRMSHVASCSKMWRQRMKRRLGGWGGEKERGSNPELYPPPLSHSLLLPQTDYWALKAPSAEAEF